MARSRKGNGKEKNKGAIPKARGDQANKSSASNEGKGKQKNTSAKNLTEQQTTNAKTLDVSKAGSFVGGDSKQREKLSNKPGEQKDKAFLVFAPPLPSESIPQKRTILKVPKRETFYQERREKDSVASRLLQTLAESRKRIESQKKSLSDAYKNLDTFPKPLTDQHELPFEHSKELAGLKIERAERQTLLTSFKDADYQNFNLDLESLGIKTEPSSKNECEETEKTKRQPLLMSFKDVDYRNPNLDLKSLEIETEPSSKIEFDETESNKEENNLKPLQHGFGSDEGKLSLGLKSSELHQPSLKDETEETSLKILDDGSMPIEQSIQDNNERIQCLDLKNLESQKDFDSRKEMERNESKSEGNESVQGTQSSQDIDERKFLLDLKNSELPKGFPSKEKVEHESNSKANQSMSSSHDIIAEVRDGICNLDLNSSKSQKNSALNNHFELKESKPAENEETISLKKDVNLRFEFDNLGNKIIWVDGKQQYNIDQKQKLAFNVGDDIKLSFNNNKVSIFTEESDVNCSLGQKRVIFSLADSIAKLDSLQEYPSKNRVSETEDTVTKDSDDVEISGATREYLASSQDIHPERSSENISSASKTDSSLVPISVLEDLKNSTDNFLKTIIASCNDYQNSFHILLNQ